MKNLKLLLFSLIFFLSLIFASATYAQDEETPEQPDSSSAFEDSFSEYSKQLEEYQAAHSTYIVKRSNYLRFKTLKSQQELQEATVKMISERDDVIISYLTMLKIRMDESVGVDANREANLNVRIADELAWFNDHKNKIPTAGTLKDLEEDNKRASQRYTFVEPLFYEILSTISDGKITDFEERLNDIFSQTKTKITEIKSETREEYKLSDRQLTQLDRWILDTENKILRAEEKQVLAGTVIDTFSGAAQRKQQSLQIYNTVLLRLNEAKQQLKEGGTFVFEILKLIKTEDK